MLNEPMLSSCLQDFATNFTTVLCFGSVPRPVIILARRYALQKQISDAFVTRGQKHLFVIKSSLKLVVDTLIIEIISVDSQISLS